MPNIVIVGGGFAGATLAKRLTGQLASEWEVILVSEDSFTTYNPLLSEVVGASIFPEHAVAPLREVIGADRHGRFVMGTVTSMDLAHKSITCSTLSGVRSYPFEHLVLAFGNRARLDLIPGMVEHSMPLKTVGDALHIRNVVLRRLAMMELEGDPDRRRMLGRFVVVGGGFSGVEIAGALADCLKGIVRYYRGVDPAEIGIVLIQNVDTLLPELPPKLGAAAARDLCNRGVDIRLGVSAREMTEDGVAVSDGSTIAAATVISTIGTQPNALVQRLALHIDRGRIPVGPILDVIGVDGVWAIGDCALVVNGSDGNICPPTAQFAVKQAQYLADTLVRTIGGRAAEPFSYHPRGQMAAVGHLSGVAEVFGLRLSGLPAWLLWRAFYLSQLPTFGRKVRLWVEWTWGMFFPPDITHIRFTRSVEHPDRASAIASVVAENMAHRRTGEGIVDELQVGFDRTIDILRSHAASAASGSASLGAISEPTAGTVAEDGTRSTAFEFGSDDIVGDGSATRQSQRSPADGSGGTSSSIIIRPTRSISG